MKRNYLSEELREISLKENISTYNKIILFVLIFISIGIGIGLLVKYPDKIMGQISIVSNQQVKKLYSPSNGELKVTVLENSEVKKGDVLGIIQSPANYEDIIKVKQLVDSVNFDNLPSTLSQFNHNYDLKLGDLEKAYIDFLTTIFDYEKKLIIHDFDQRIQNNSQKINRNLRNVVIKNSELEINETKLRLLDEMILSDSLLFSVNAITEDEFKKAKISHLSSKQREVDLRFENQELININDDLNDQILLLKDENEKMKQMAEFNLKKSFYVLITSIQYWEHNHLIKSSIDGKIEFYQGFFDSGQYVRKDEPLFIVLPKIDRISGRGRMPAEGYGKIKLNDTVSIELKDYPFTEFGRVKGVITSMSKVYHDSVYFIDVTLSKGFVTDKGKPIHFKYNMAGEIYYISERRSLFSRIFNEIDKSVSN